MIETGLACISTGIAAWTILFLPPLHPAQLWSVPWGFATALFALHLLPYPPMTAVEALLILGALASFTCGALVGERISTSVPVRGAAWGHVDTRILRRAALWVIVGTGLLFSFFIIQVSQTFGIGAALISSSAVRHAIGEGFASITIKYLYLAIALAALAGLLAGIAETRAVRRRWLVAALLAVASTYFSTGRSTILLATLAAVASYFGVRPLRTARLLALGAGVVLLALGALIVGGALIGKTYQNSPLRPITSYFSERPQLSTLALPYEYVTAPLSALEVEISNTRMWGRRHGCATFGPVCTVLHAAGLPAEAEPEIRPFTPPPLPWNTYTALDKPLIDGGFVLALPIVFLLGLFSGHVWRRARLGYMSSICIYGIIASAVVNSTGANSFFAPHVVGSMVAVVVAIEASKAWELGRGLPSHGLTPSDHGRPPHNLHREGRDLVRL